MNIPTAERITMITGGSKVSETFVLISHWFATVAASAFNLFWKEQLRTTTEDQNWKDAETHLTIPSLGYRSVRKHMRDTSNFFSVFKHDQGGELLAWAWTLATIHTINISGEHTWCMKPSGVPSTSHKIYMGRIKCYSYWSCRFVLIRWLQQDI